MRKSDFFYDLPPELIAQVPVEPRSASRLLCLDGATGSLTDRRFANLPDLLSPGDLLVFNNSRVIPARLFGRKATGGRVELLVERVLGDRQVLAQGRARRPLKPGEALLLEGGVEARVLERRGVFLLLDLETESPVFELLERVGHVPLPPYIERPDGEEDRQRYQTVYAERPGAVAAPTAGLHFDEKMFERLRGREVETAFLTLHVGAGTFQPIRVEEIREHRMHAESLEVNEEVCRQVRAARREGRRVIAVGTTVVRALEAAAQAGTLAPYKGETDLFIYPGYRFRTVDALLTNFHLPGSTLLMLVCAFAGTERVLQAYRHAARERYRFYSFGDAMFVTPAA